MKKFIKQIYLVWRRGRNDSRIKVGKLTKNVTDGIRFQYIEEGVKEAMEKGFTMYPDFPDIDRIYTQNVLEIFSQRLTKTERSDIQKYFNYWEILPTLKDDKFYVLAQTQGLLLTDNFEFIAEYYPVRNLNFTSEVCGLTRRKLDIGTIEVGDILQWKIEKNNPFDKYAVKLLKNGIELGYVKTIHAKVFHDSKYKSFQISVKSLEQNVYITRAFIKVETINKF
jgi:hypothetical protein